LELHHSFVYTLYNHLYTYSSVTSTKSHSFSIISFSASLTNFSSLLPQSRDCSCYVSRPIPAPPLLWLSYAHTISRTLPTCDISLGSLMSPMSEAGDNVEFILLYTCRFSIRVYQTSYPNYMSKISSIDFILMHSCKIQLTTKYLDRNTGSDQILVKMYIVLYHKCKVKLFLYTYLRHTFRKKK
jgi:hypothetical protein